MSPDLQLQFSFDSLDDNFNELPDARAEVLNDLIGWIRARLPELRSVA